MPEPVPASVPVPAGPARRSEFTIAPGLRVETYVEGAGPPVVMLPSYGRDGGADFDLVAAGFAAAGFRVLRPQPRGTAGSTGATPGVSLHQLAEDVALVINSLGGGRAAIVGHAFGNYVARMVATDHPAQVRGIVLASAAASAYPAEIAATPARAGDLQASEEDRLAALRLGFFAEGNDPRAWLDGWYPKTLAMQMGSQEKAGVKQSDWWSAGGAPLLELIPASDPFKPRDRWGELAAAFGARVRTVVIQGASHALFPEQPLAVTAAAVPWLRTLPE